MIGPGSAEHFTNVLGDSMLPPDVQSKGYFVVTSVDGSSLPQIVAKTYNVDLHGGTFGQNLKVFGESDLIYEGSSGFITGVSNSPDPETGSRTNVGVLNTSLTNTAVLYVKIYDETGERRARIPVQLGPGIMDQQNIFSVAYLGDVEMDGSIEVEVVSGGPVAAYGSQVDNQTQDPILIPAVTAEGLTQ
jgi:hypothetical protein